MQLKWDKKSAPLRALFFWQKYLLPLSSVEELWKPQGHAWPDIHEGHTSNHDKHVRHHACENLVERNAWWRDTFKIEGRHRHWWRQERCLQVHEHQDTPQKWVDIKVS